MKYIRLGLGGFGKVKGEENNNRKGRGWLKHRSYINRAPLGINDANRTEINSPKQPNQGLPDSLQYNVNILTICYPQNATKDSIFIPPFFLYTHSFVFITFLFLFRISYTTSSHHKTTYTNARWRIVIQRIFFCYFRKMTYLKMARRCVRCDIQFINERITERFVLRRRRRTGASSFRLIANKKKKKKRRKKQRDERS